MRGPGRRNGTWALAERALETIFHLKRSFLILFGWFRKFSNLMVHLQWLVFVDTLALMDAGVQLKHSGRNCYGTY